MRIVEQIDIDGGQGNILEQASLYYSPTGIRWAVIIILVLAASVQLPRLIILTGASSALVQLPDDLIEQKLTD